MHAHTYTHSPLDFGVTDFYILFSLVCSLQLCTLFWERNACYLLCKNVICIAGRHPPTKTCPFKFQGLSQLTGKSIRHLVLQTFTTDHVLMIFDSWRLIWQFRYKMMKSVFVQMHLIHISFVGSSGAIMFVGQSTKAKLKKKRKEKVVTSICSTAS